MSEIKDSVLSTLQDGYYEVDLEGNLTRFNRALAEVFDRDPEQLAGLNYRDYTHPDYRDQVYQVFNEVYRTGVPNNRFFYQVFRPAGEVRSAQYSVHLMRDESGEPVGFCGIVRDVTEEEKAKRKNETLRSISELVFGTLELDEVLKRCCDQVAGVSVGDRASLYLYDREQEALRPVMSRGLRDSSLWEIFQNLNEISPGENPVIARMLHTGEPVIIEDVRKTDQLQEFFAETFGTVSLALYPLTARRDYVGFFVVDSVRRKVDFPESEVDLLRQVSRYLASAISQAQLFEAVREEAYRFRLITTAMRDLIMVCTFDNKVDYLSPSFAAVTGYKQSDLQRINLMDRVNFADRDPLRKWFRAHFGGAVSGTQGKPLEFRLYCTDGQEHWFEVTANGIEPVDGKFTKVVLTGRMIDERKRLEAEMRQRAFYDTVTGLPNRSLLQDRLAHALQRVERSGYQVGVGFIDLDRFKAVNDRLGHAAGDRVLKATAEVLGHYLRPSDTLARFGGDEFVLLIEDLSDLTEARDIVKRLNSVLSNPVRVDNQRVKMTASIGLTFSRPGSTDADRLLSEADDAMYEAKKAGGGRVVERRHTGRLRPGDD